MDPREDLVRHYRWLRRYGLNDSHSGNASFRQGDGYWITPTGACADILSADALIRCALEDEPVAGASLDARLHRSVYRHNPKAGAVLHSHGPYTLAATLDGNDFTALDFEGQYYFPRVPVIDIPYDAYVEQSPDKVGQTLAEYPVAVVRGHGVYACAESINLAYKWTCSLESSAKIRVLAGR